MRFAGANGTKDMDARFAGADWTTLVTGAPALSDANASFDCRVVRSVEIGTHDALFCEVVAIREAPSSQGLVYYGRRIPPRDGVACDASLGPGPIGYCRRTAAGRFNPQSPRAGACV